MSFSRARVQRFNEKLSCTPSPADYNPVQKTHAGSVISTTATEKFSDNASVISNESSCFRTPTLIRKKKPLLEAKVNPTKLFKTNDNEILREKIVECNNKDAYIKDLTEQIEELRTQLSELRKQKLDIESERNRYEMNLSDLKEKQKDDLDNLVLAHTNKMNLLTTKLQEYSTKLATLKEEHTIMRDERKSILENVLKDFNEMGEMFNANVTKTFSDEIESKECRLREKQIEINKINEELAIAEKKNAEEIKNLSERHKKESSNIELEMLAIITNSEKVLDEQKKVHELRMLEIENTKNLEIDTHKNNYSNQIATLQKQKELDLKQFEEDYKTAKKEIECHTKQQIKEIEAIWKSRFKEHENETSEALRIYQQESESKIIELELEKNKLKQQLSDLNEELELIKNETDIMQKFEQLQINYNQEIICLKTKCKVLEAQKTTVENELSELVNTSHAYQITLQKTRETVDAISKRLLDSDHDVECLKKQLEVCEMRKLNLEAECNKYHDKIEILTKSNTELEEMQEETVGIYRNELQAVKKELESKIEHYKNLMEEITKKNGNLFKQKQSQLDETKQQLDIQQKLNKEAQDLTKHANARVSALEGANINLKEELDQLSKELKEKKECVGVLTREKQKLEQQLQKEMENNEKLRHELSNIDKKDVEVLNTELVMLQEKCETTHQYSEYYKSKVEEYEKEIEDTKKVQKNYNEQSKKYEELLQKFNLIQDDKVKLEKTLEDYNSLIGPYREQLEAYEYERKLLLSQKSNAEVEAVTMSAKYAEILGQQNQKQKIKHLIDLKEKNMELAKANKSLEAKMRSQAKTIEKLNKELAGHMKTPKKLIVVDKENVNSPCICCSPLRDKN